MSNTRWLLIGAITLGLMGADSTAQEDGPIMDLFRADSTSAENVPASATAPIPTMKSIMSLGPNDDIRKILSETAGVVLIDFYADWCGPCRLQNDVLESVAQIVTNSNSKILKVNVDKYPQLADHFEVEALPTMVVLQRGRVIARSTGVSDQREIASFLPR